ncbi:MAG: hypothetical protein ACLTLQ_15650 [[Clostridium] scindens]
MSSGSVEVGAVVSVGDGIAIDLWGTRPRDVWGDRNFLEKWASGHGARHPGLSQRCKACIAIRFGDDSVHCWQWHRSGPARQGAGIPVGEASYRQDCGSLFGAPIDGRGEIKRRRLPSPIERWSAEESVERKSAGVPLETGNPGPSIRRFPIGRGQREH